MELEIGWGSRKLSHLFRYAGHVFIFGGVSPLRCRKSEALSEGKGVAVRRGLKEA